MNASILKMSDKSVFLTLLVLLSFSSLRGQDKVLEKPNILLIITDQHHVDAMSCVGNTYLKTPNIDKLAGDGVLFSNNYVTQPLCLPFRSSLQTGRYPHQIGTIRNGLKIKEGNAFLGNLVKSAGYTSDYIGKWHVGATEVAAGYNYEESKKSTDTKRATAAEAFLLKKREQPFFLTVSFMNPHNICELARADAIGTNLPDGPIELAPDDLSKLPPLPDNFEIPENEPTVLREIQGDTHFHYPTQEWDEKTWRQYLWGYYRLVEKVDAEIGKVLAALKNGGYEDNTIVIFTSDHGEGVAMHHWNQKQILYDESVKTPFIIQWKGETKKRVYSELVSNALDIPVTILDVIGTDIPKEMEGKSLKPILEGKSVKPRKYVVSETMFAQGDKELGATGRMIRTKKYKYCIYDNGEKREQLFDMKNDPGEMKNLVYEKGFEKILIKHRKLIGKWAKETNDKEFPYYKMN
ncbi:sulfatase family protein [Urechidicola vernalis]|uniref:Sulfatase-like hydrolase/transferase n=1 Tax=Urechidicola vernalis TaxID=3075600 RepID=A0ABU2YAE7_9FLAO|nr:sulfatase-like hydrolase/transferase [Urechidicola sp. P050]MDT0554038.1 sulfatase-like hydrolase/transferase [Urechidicola sp. P050]